jgi:DNA-binding NarL/FixJ family response regulator
MIQDVDTFSPATVVLVDDSPELRLLYSILLGGCRDCFRVVGEAGDGPTAVELAQQLHPDLMLLDLSMPGMSGLEALPLILQVSPATRVFMLSGYDREWMTCDPVTLGACGVLGKSLPPDKVIEHLTSELAANQ